MSPETLVRFIEKIHIGPHCWTWKGATAGRGYGVFHVPDVGMQYAHRIAHEAFIGPIPDGNEVDHLCFEITCVKPTHLEAVTPDQNKQRARPDFCQHGHPFDDVNTYTDRRGYRQCRICQRERDRLKRAKRKAVTA